jgi:hypothetical protein
MGNLAWDALFGLWAASHSGIAHDHDTILPGPVDDLDNYNDRSRYSSPEPKLAMVTVM